MPRALITGITGQDGSYLAEHLLEKGYDVYGLIRRSSVVTDQRIRHLLGRVELLDGDLLDQLSLIKAVQQARRTRSTTWPPSPSCPPPGPRPCSPGSSPPWG